MHISRLIYQVKAKLCQERGANKFENHLLKEFKGLNKYPEDHFVDVNPIGQGEFGVVEKAILIDGSARHPVALKTVKNSSDRIAIVSKPIYLFMILEKKKKDLKLYWHILL